MKKRIIYSSNRSVEKFVAGDLHRSKKNETSSLATFQINERNLNTNSICKTAVGINCISVCDKFLELQHALRYLRMKRFYKMSFKITDRIKANKSDEIVAV